MQLNLSAGARRLSIESTLDGFVEVVRHSAQEAAANDLALDAATCNNLIALGVVPPVTPA